MRESRNEALHDDDDEVVAEAAKSRPFFSLSLRREKNRASRIVELAEEEKKWNSLKRASLRLRKRFAFAENSGIAQDKKNPFCVERRIMDRKCLLLSNKNPSLQRPLGGDGRRSSREWDSTLVRKPLSSSGDRFSSYGEASSRYKRAKGVYASRKQRNRSRRKVADLLMKNHTPRGGIIERNGNGSTFGIHMSSYQNSQTFSSTNRGSAGNIYTSAAQTSVVGPSFGHRPNSASRIFDPSSKTVTGSRIVLRETNLCDDISRDSDQSNLSGLLTAKDLTRLLSDSGPSPSRHRSQCKRRQRRNGSGYGSTSTFSTKEKRAKKKEYNFNNRLHLLPSETRKTKVLWGHREKADISTHRRIERFETRAVEGKEGDVYYDLEKDDDDYEAKEMDSDDEYRLDAKRFNSLTPMTSSFVTTRWHAVPSAISHREVRDILRDLDVDQYRVERSEIPRGH